MKKLKLSLLILFLFAGVFIANGCSNSSGGFGVVNTVRGTVVDTTNATISGMNCTLLYPSGQTESTVSDANGNFSFANLTEGEYNIICDDTGYIRSRYYITVTNQGETYRAVTSVKMVVLTPSEFDSFAGAGHLYDPTLGYIMPLVLDSNDLEMGGVSFSSTPGAIDIGYVGAGIDWNATSTVAGQGRALMEVTPGPSYEVTAEKSGSSFDPGSQTITPQQGELTLIQFQER